MGCDIHGWIEIRLPGLDEWLKVVHAGLIFDREYKMFACLFGVRNYWNLRPLFAMRGRPFDSDKRETVLGHSATFATYRELSTIDLDEPIEEVSVGRFARDGQSGKEREVGHPGDWGDDGPKLQPLLEGVTEIGVIDDIFGEVVYRITNRAWNTRGAILRASSYWTVFEVMKALARQFGDDNVRLVVGFDS
jgi:hypothetical protein